MPVFRTTLSDGRVVTFEAAAQPSEAEILAAIDGGSSPETTPSAAQEPAVASTEDGFMANLGDFLTGAGKGVASTVGGLGELTTRAARGYSSAMIRPDLRQAAGVEDPMMEIFGDSKATDDFRQYEEEFTTPTNTAQKWGKGVEQVAEFLLPGPGKGAALKGIKGMSGAGVMEAAKVALSEGAKNTAVSLAQQGSPNAQVAAEGVTGALAPGLTSAGLGGAKAVLGAPARAAKPYIGKLADKLKVDMPAFALSSHPAVQALESYAARGLGGAKVVERIDKAFKKLDTMVANLANKAGTVDLSDAGRSVYTGFEAAETQFRQTADDLYKQAIVTNKVKLQPTRTVELLKEIVEGKSAADVVGVTPADLPFYRNLLNGGKKKLGLKGANGAWDIKQALDAMKDKVKEWNTTSTGSAATLKRVAATLNEELDEAIDAADPVLGQALRDAKAHYAEGIGKITSAYGQNIERLAANGEWDKIVPAVLNKNTSVDLVQPMFEFIGKEARDDIRASVLAEIVTKARGETGMLTPRGLSQQIKHFGQDRLQAILEPTQWRRLKDIADLTASMSKAETVRAGGGRVAAIAAPLLRTGAAGAAISAMFFQPMAAFSALVGLTAGDYAMSKLIGTKAAQKWMTKGVAVPAIASSAVPNLAGVAAVKALAPGDEEQEP